MFYFLTESNDSALPGKTENTEIVSFHLNVLCCDV